MKDFGDQGTQLKWIGRQRKWTSTVITIGASIVAGACIAYQLAFLGKD